MKKICFITTVSATLKTFVLELAKVIYKKGDYEITFICNPDENFQKQLPPYIRFIPVEMKRGMALSGISTVLKLYNIFKKEKFDYIQYSTPNAAFYSSIASYLTGQKIRVYAQWGMRYIGASGMGRKILKCFEKITCVLSTHIRPVSKKNMNFAIDEGLYKANKAIVRGNGGTIGVDLGKFDISKKDELRRKTRSKFLIPENSFVFGYVGRLHIDKGINELIEAFKNLSEKETNIFLMLVGPDDIGKGIRKDLYSWSKNSKNVIYTGMQEQNELISFYSAFDCYIHPTYREGFGMVLQEAGALAIPIITTDIPGASEVMEKDVSCKLVLPKNSVALQSAMNYMLKNPEKNKEIGLAAYKRTKEFYERSIMIGNIIEDIEEIMRGV